MHNIFSLGAVLSRVPYQGTRDWTLEHFQPHHFKHPEAINNQNQGTGKENGYLTTTFTFQTLLALL